ncbi:carbohydrate kinase family protein [Collimonas sp. OK307]|uniref:carbohydrate kinase family protein n=1 Tax=Collimonas sp. OK307 TaxID=1801620 RepID=UPI001C31CC3A|nr:carbohydrate kinase family protein [Collimonas sp. OK307]
MSASANRHFGLLAFGDPNLDRVFAVDTIPGADEKCLGRGVGTYAGGTVANVACAASRLDVVTGAYGRVGADSTGDFLRAEFHRDGVDTRYLRSITGAASANALIIVDGCGEKAMVYEPMAGRVLDAATLAQAVGESRVIHAMPYDLDEFQDLSKLAQDAGSMVSIDIESAMIATPRHFNVLLASSNIVFMNEKNFSTILRKPVTSENVRQLLTLGPAMVVITRGAQGAIAVSRSETIEQSVFAADVVDVTGAGDCFIGAFIAAMLERQTLAEATRFACAAASVAVTVVGARSALPTRAEVASRLSASPVVL